MARHRHRSAWTGPLRYRARIRTRVGGHRHSAAGWRTRIARLDGARPRRGCAHRRQCAGRHRSVSPRSADRRSGAAPAVVDGRLLRPPTAVCSSASGSGAGRRRCAVARAGRNRQRDSAAAVGRASRAAAGALRLGRTVGAALTEQRVLEPAEARLLALVGAVLLGVAVAASFWPLLIAAPLSVILVWIALSLLARAYSLRRTRRARGQP